MPATPSLSRSDGFQHGTILASYPGVLGTRVGTISTSHFPLKITFLHLCIIYYRTLHIFIQCTTTCGTGVQTREIQCLSPVTETVVNHDFCDSATMPAPRQECFLRNCRKYGMTKMYGITIIFSQ